MPTALQHIFYQQFKTSIMANYNYGLLNLGNGMFKDASHAWTEIDEKMELLGNAIPTHRKRKHNGLSEKTLVHRIFGTSTS